MAASTIVLITGGNTGIGYETVKALYASPEAHTILMGSRSLEKANDAISALKAEVIETKSTVEAVQIDIESDDSINAAFDTIKSAHGRIDALVNNAGTISPLLQVHTHITNLTLKAAPSTPSSAPTPAPLPSATSGTTPTLST